MPSWLNLKSSDDINNRKDYSIRNYTLIAAHLLGMFKNFTPKGENTFITFNYDTLLEDALIELGLRQVVFVNPDKENELQPKAKELLREAYIKSNQITFEKSGLSEFTICRVGGGDTILHKFGRPTEKGTTMHFQPNQTFD